MPPSASQYKGRDRYPLKFETLTLLETRSIFNLSEYGKKNNDNLIFVQFPPKLKYFSKRQMMTTYLGWLPVLGLLLVLTPFSPSLVALCISELRNPH